MTSTSVEGLRFQNCEVATSNLSNLFKGKQQIQLVLYISMHRRVLFWK